MGSTIAGIPLIFCNILQQLAADQCLLQFPLAAASLDKQLILSSWWGLGVSLLFLIIVVYILYSLKVH